MPTPYWPGDPSNMPAPLLSAILPSLIQGGFGFMSGLFGEDEQERNSYQNRPGVDPEVNLRNFYEAIYQLIPSIMERANTPVQLNAQAPMVPGSRLRDPGPAPIQRPGLPTDLFPTRTSTMRAGPQSPQPTRRNVTGGWFNNIGGNEQFNRILEAHNQGVPGQRSPFKRDNR